MDTGEAEEVGVVDGEVESEEWGGWRDCECVCVYVCCVKVGGVQLWLNQSFMLPLDRSLSPILILRYINDRDII